MWLKKRFPFLKTKNRNYWEESLDEDSTDTGPNTPLLNMTNN